jgi:hypothetical protein
MPLTLVQTVQKPGARAKIATKLAVIRQCNRSRTDGERSKHKSKGSQRARTSSVPPTNWFGRIAVGHDLPGRFLTGLRPRDEHFRVRQSEKPDRDLLKFSHCCHLDKLFSRKQLATREHAVQMRYLHIC